MQAQSLGVGRAQAGEPALGQQKVAFIAERPRSGAPEGRILAKGVDECPQAGRLDHRVRVEEENEFRRAGSGPEVAAVGETTVSRCPDGVDREIGDDRSRVVGRRVVDDRHLHPGERGEGFDAGAQGVAAVVGDDHGVDHGGGRCSARLSERGAVLDRRCDARIHLGVTNERGQRSFSPTRQRSAQARARQKDPSRNDFGDPPEDPRPMIRSSGEERTNELRPYPGSAGLSRDPGTQ